MRYINRLFTYLLTYLLLSISFLEVDWKAWDGEEFEDNGVLYLVNIEL